MATATERSVQPGTYQVSVQSLAVSTSFPTSDIPTHASPGGDAMLGLVIENAGAVALSDLELQVSCGGNEWITVLSGAAWDTPGTRRLVSRTGKLSELAATTTKMAQIILGPVLEWRLRAKVAAGSTTLNYHALVTRR